VAAAIEAECPGTWSRGVLQVEDDCGRRTSSSNGTGLTPRAATTGRCTRRTWTGSRSTCGRDVSRWRSSSYHTLLNIHRYW